MITTIALSILAYTIVVGTILAIVRSGARYDRETERLALTEEQVTFGLECALSTELADHSLTRNTK